MPNREVPWHTFQNFLVEDLANQPHLLVDHDPAAVAYRDPR